MAVKLIFSFDSEDYETPASDNAEKWWAETMARHGFKPCACVVGELARALRRRGRQDVIEAMKRCEIAYHSNMHSAHPTWAEYLDVCSWDQGVNRALREESVGISSVREVFGQQPSAWCKPGASWGPQIAEAMRRLNVHVFCDSPFEWAPGAPLWFANALFLNYHTSFDRYFDVPAPTRLEKMKKDFLDLCAKREGRYLIMYTHPCRLVTASFPKNFTAGANPPRKNWKPAPLRSPEEVAGLQRDFDAFLEFAAGLKCIERTTYREFFKEYDPGPEPWLTREQIRELVFSRSDIFDIVEISGMVLSPAEQFGVIVATGAALAETGALPTAVSAQRLLGPRVKVAQSVPSEVLCERVLRTCCVVRDDFRETGATPSSVRLGMNEVGPHAFMEIVRGILKVVFSNGKLPSRASVRPVDELPVFAKRPDIEKMSFQNSWSIFPPDFEGRHVLEAIRLQTWTAKPARKTGRK